VQGAASGTAGETAPPLEPGSAIGLKLVRGDVELVASGTVTWIDGDGVLAFGHPLFGLGAVDLPLTAARVETLLPSLQSSTKLAVPLNEIGALRQDRTAAVYGRLGAEPQMIPIRVQFDRADESETFSFDVADDPLLAPV
ncbi:MAG: peptidase S55 SpoIVB, partial [Acidobacteria bacterium]|nr:peptidase S55 SpoIVB [Acidobacteriota bacterium]NIQ85008.1 peptidase S55 SpoIVB [Acidobacteriota bacterium]